MYIELKLPQEKPGQGSKKVKVQPQNVDAFIRKGFKFKDKEEEKKFKDTGLRIDPKIKF